MQTKITESLSSISQTKAFQPREISDWTTPEENIIVFFSITYGYQYNARTGSAAYRWQPEMLTCYEKTFDAIRNLLRKFDVSNTEEDNVMRSEIINAYSSFLYNLCLPSCKLNLLQKRKLAQQARKKFQVKRYLKLYSTANSSLFDKAKLLLYEPIWRVC